MHTPLHVSYLSASGEWGIFFLVIPIFKREFVSGLIHCGTELCLQ